MGVQNVVGEFCKHVCIRLVFCMVLRATQHDTEDPMVAIIGQSPITCKGPTYSTYGNSPFPAAVYCTCCAKGSKANNTVAHADPTHGGTKGLCLPVVAARHEHLCFPIYKQKKTGLPIVPFRIFKTYGSGLAQLVIKINFLGGCVEGLPLFTAPQSPPTG